MRKRLYPLTPGAVRAARILFPKASRKKLRQVAQIIDDRTHLAFTIRTCAIILFGLETLDRRKKKIALGLGRYALRDVIRASGYCTWV
ncbi:MAG: hypothetical protein NTW87_11195 [Planctomycetota bacterium]|nr:hypothetical protein [Planctomycetota bacterium]